ncbi:hypothetical protein X943_003274 [Babesia divergens]|uniref:J domain-containing protein n=1 Tax=Babesia divergens TaxID=32595 RepID=A0AAD9LEH6_BABDI|nr:hypothetical protein X943_003274 [Babesia divergens]
MSNDRPAILDGVDVFAVLGVEVQEDVDVAEAKRGLRRIFLKRAKECHPDKQTASGKSSDKNLEFARLKAAFDYLQNDEIFNTLYNRVLHQRRAERLQKERNKGIAAKQSAHLDALLRREKAAAEAAAARESKAYNDKHAEYQAHYSDVSEGFATTCVQPDASIQGHGTLIVAARTMKIANESEINCLLLSDHFPKAFSNFGMLRVDPIDIVSSNPEEVNVKVGVIIFESHEHALKALLYYRNNRTKFRPDLYALALGPQGSAVKAKEAYNGEGSTLDEMESVILKRLRQAVCLWVKKSLYTVQAAKKRRTLN